jgi:hypothetical protein
LSKMFDSFFLAGFEGATGYDRQGRWFDQVVATGHDREAANDYALIAAAGFRAARECVRWPLVDTGGGRLDFSSVQPMIDAARANNVQVIWDLFHFGYPRDLDPLSRSFRERFADYCAAAARYLAPQMDDPLWVTPVNEPSYFAFAAGDERLFAPHLTGAGHDLKIALAAAAIAGIDAIRSVSPGARILNVDPLCCVTAPVDRPDLQAEARAFNETCVYEAWDILAGRLYPELGGSAAHLDVVGINYYWTNQWEIGGPCEADGVKRPLADEDSRRKPLSELVAAAMDRYGHDVLISETSHYGASRAGWLRTIGAEINELTGRGYGLSGICLYPILGMTDWHEPERWIPMGLWDCEEATPPGRTRRKIDRPMLRELKTLMAAQQAENYRASLHSNCGTA